MLEGAVRHEPITGNPGRYHGNPSCCSYYGKVREPNIPTMAIRKHEFNSTGPQSWEKGHSRKQKQRQHRKTHPLCHLLGIVWHADILFCHPEMDMLPSLQDRTQKNPRLRFTGQESSSRDLAPGTGLKIRK